jgi:hypothetical protein
MVSELNVSARPNRRAKNVGILAIVIPKLELINVERKILAAHLMERSHDPALDHGPEAFDGVGVDRAVDVFTGAVVYSPMRIQTIQATVATVFVGADQAHAIRNHFPNESANRVHVGVVDHTRDDVALAFDSADDDCFSCAASAAEVAASARPFVLVLRLAADVGFIHFDVADQLLELGVAEGHANLAAHEPRGLVGAEAHVAEDLQGAHALLAG